MLDENRAAERQYARAGEGTRTPDTCFTRAVLYQLSYAGVVRRSLGARYYSVAPESAFSRSPWPFVETTAS